MPGSIPQVQIQRRLSLPIVTDVGAGPPVIFLHSMAGSAESWTQQIDQLSNNFRCLAWDMPGYGESPAVPESTTLEQLCGLLLELLDESGIDQPVHLVGLSVGGMIAQRFAIENPQRVASLVILDSSASFGDGANSEANHWADEATQSIRATSHEQYCYEMVHNITADGTPDSVKTTAVSSMRRSTVSGLCLAARLIAAHDAREELSAITVPTTVLVGDCDHETPESYARSIANAIPGAHLIVIPEAGHLSNIEAPAAVTSILLDHLRAVSL